MQALTVAAIQATSENGQPARNLSEAEPLVGRAVEQGAELIVCPEFLAAGYIYDDSIWEAGEPVGGSTEAWLSRLAVAHRVTIGAGFLEAVGDEFYNTFSLFGPDGALLGRVRKASLPFFEGWYFRPDHGPKVIDTHLGRVAVGICNDCQTAGFLGHLAENRPDLILLPHSAPTPRLPLGALGSGIYGRLYEWQLRGIAGKYASALGVPVVMANKVSFEDTTSPLPIRPGARVSWRFRGYSSIWDGQGTRRAELVDQAGALVAVVRLDPAARGDAPPPSGSYFAFAPRLIDAAMGPLLQGLAARGQRGYSNSSARVAAARAIQTETDADHRR